MLEGGREGRRVHRVHFRFFRKAHKESFRDRGEKQQQRPKRTLLLSASHLGSRKVMAKLYMIHQTEQGQQRGSVERKKRYMTKTCSYFRRPGQPRLCQKGTSLARGAKAKESAYLSTYVIARQAGRPSNSG